MVVHREADHGRDHGDERDAGLGMRVTCPRTDHERAERADDERGPEGAVPEDVFEVVHDP